jgi:hypothetical protein
LSRALYEYLYVIHNQTHFSKADFQKPQLFSDLGSWISSSKVDTRLAPSCNLQIINRILKASFCICEPSNNSYAKTRRPSAEIWMQMKSRRMMLFPAPNEFTYSLKNRICTKASRLFPPTLPLLGRPPPSPEAKYAKTTRFALRGQARHLLGITCQLKVDTNIYRARSRRPIKAPDATRRAH